MDKYRFLLWTLFYSLVVFSQQHHGPTVAFLLGKEKHQLKDNFLLNEAAEAYELMRKAALADGFTLRVVSSYRTYESQKRIWNKKYKRFTNEGLSPQEAIRKIIQYSTLPGTSRHHWGTEIDVIDSLPQVAGDVLLEKHFHGGPYTALRIWLEKHTHQYGYELVYTQDSLRKGFLYEPWHYSYAPLSRRFLTHYLTADAINQIAKDTTLLGHQFINLPFLTQYQNEHIMGIAKSLQPLSIPSKGR